MSPLLHRSLALSILLMAVTLGVAAVVVADQGSHSVSDTLIGASPVLALVALGALLAIVAVERAARARRGR